MSYTKVSFLERIGYEKAGQGSGIMRDLGLDLYTGARDLGLARARAPTTDIKAQEACVTLTFVRGHVTLTLEELAGACCFFLNEYFANKEKFFLCCFLN